MPATEPAQAEIVLLRREHQQALVASFGQFALRGSSNLVLMQEAARLGAAGLGAAFAKVLEHDAVENTLVVRAGVGWRPGVVGHAWLPPGRTSPAGYAFDSGESTVSNDLAADHRFGVPPLLSDHGVRREVNAVIRGDGPTFGVLEVDDTGDGQFSAADIHFLEALGNILGLALERERISAERERLLAERSNLLAEVHHRIRNSLQLVHTVLSLQASEALEPGTREMLASSALRVLTIAAVHEQLYQNDHFGTVEIRDYVVSLVGKLRVSVASLAPGRSVRLLVEGGASWPSRRAEALGMVLTELVTNAMKYGEGEVAIRFVLPPAPEGPRLEVDGGGTLPIDFDPAGGGMGLRIVAALLREHGAVLRVDSGALGARFVAQFDRSVVETA